MKTKLLYPFCILRREVYFKLENKGIAVCFSAPVIGVRRLSLPRVIIRRYCREV